MKRTGQWQEFGGCALCHRGARPPHEHLGWMHLGDGGAYVAYGRPYAVEKHPGLHL